MLLIKLSNTIDINCDEIVEIFSGLFNQNRRNSYREPVPTPKMSLAMCNLYLVRLQYEYPIIDEKQKIK